MARQKGINEIIGTIGNLTYFKSKRGYMVRRKSSFSKDQFYSNERMAVCRDYSKEFKNASIAGTLLRNAFRPVLSLGKDTYHVSRLIKIMKTLISMDEFNTRGNREVVNGDMNLLKNFNFNEDCKLEQCFTGVYETKHDKTKGSFNLIIKAFVPLESLEVKESMTHFKMINIYSLIDFYNNDFNQSLKETDFLTINHLSTSDILFNHKLPKKSSLPCFGILGIQFFREVNGYKYIVKDRLYNPVAIMDVV